jgi:PAS domain S-box-containing protein
MAGFERFLSSSVQADFESATGEAAEDSAGDIAAALGTSSLRVLLDALPGLVCVSSADGRTEYMNKRVTDYTGKSAAELLNFSWTWAIHPDDVESVTRRWLQAVAAGNDHEDEFRIRSAAGVYRWFHSSATPHRDARGRIVRWYAVIHDVDDRKTAEEALQARQAELAHATRVIAMGELAASIAHELNQPLMAIVTDAQTTLLNLAKDRPNLDEARCAVESVVRSGHRAGDILRSIRSLVKKSPVETTELDINSVIGDSLDLMHAELRRHRVSLETEFANHKPVMGDRVQLQQVILNLVVNGIEAMKAVNHRPRLLRVSTQLDEGGNLLTAVEDSGTGLDPATIDRIFDPLFTTKREGMGMGLSICRSIIEAHGGRLWASSNLHHGSVFRFSLPAVKNGIKTDSSSPGSSTDRGRHR